VKAFTAPLTGPLSAPLTALLALLAALPAARVAAATAYVSDELVLGVYAEQNNQGQRLTTLHSGASVDTLSSNGEFTEVRLNDGTTGWVKSTFLTTREPATVRVKRLEEELDRSRATTPALAEAAARSEVLQLQRELAAKQAELDAARPALALPMAAPGAATASVGNEVAAASGVMAAMSAAVLTRPWLSGLSVLFALAGGFWLGYVTLARRVKRKFGGIKVY
jgi:SH3 domain protein